MSQVGFHPVVARWFAERIGEPTEAQRRGWEEIGAGRDVLIAAPTGSGKTLAAFLSAIDALFREGVERGLPDEVRVVYVSPLKALSADIHRNLAEPRAGIRRIAEEAGLPPVRIHAAVRTGDTPQGERAAMLRKPPHILVTTPESLYLLLTAERSREMLRTATTVIVDEIHAVLESRRGSHLALTLERLDHACGRRLQRIGLSATQKPIEVVAEFLCGTRARDDGGRAPVVIDAGHVRNLDVGLEVPGSPLEAVMSGEVWEEVYDRVAELIRAHRTTLVFVNTRRLAERVTRHLEERLGAGEVLAHHGSLSKERRLDAEERLKAGGLRALVATASLELGIDIGHVDLVCQIGSPRRIAAFLQRVGRSGHTVRGTPKGRIFPLSRDELIECTALLRAVRAGELDRAIIPDKPLDVLAQQIAAEVACEEWDEDALFCFVRRAYPYRTLERHEFDDVVRMLAGGFTTRRGRRNALIHRDAVNGKLRARRSTRMVAIGNGGAIPELADYRVVLEPEGTFIGTLNEDFAIESMVGDVFQLGNASWRILRILPGVVRVADARGEPPNIPFWLGEAPVRSAELSAAVSALRADVEARLAESEDASDAVVEDFARDHCIPLPAAEQMVGYLAETRRVLGALPTQHTLILERFFDEAGGMQLVLHAPFGARINRAWGLSLRKKFCKTFNFELQAAATDDGLLLSLGPQHSFPLADVFRFLQPATLRDTLVQALLDSPMFQTRWRWTTTLSLAVQRSRNGKKVPPQIQRMQAEDVLAAVFPDAAACFENIEGEREVPDHPLVAQSIRDCLEEAMDLPGLEAIVRRILAGELTLLARDTPEPSPLCHELLNARPYAFLDDAPLEERRTQAVYTRRALEPSHAKELGALDAEAIARVRQEAWPDAASADELHDALLTCGFLRADELTTRWSAFLDALAADGRVACVRADARTALWVTAERLPELRAVHPQAAVEPAAIVPAEYDRTWTREDAIRELVRGRLQILGPTTGAAIARSLGITDMDAEVALVAIEAEGMVLRGAFTRGAQEREWCERRLLARVHRYTLNRLRAEIQPVTPAEFMRFLFHWQHVERDERVAGLEGLAAVLEQLDGFEVAAGAWESHVLPARMRAYSTELLDMLCLTGRVAWSRLGPRLAVAGGAAGPLRSTPIALFARQHARHWLALAERERPAISPEAERVLYVLESRGASFFHELASAAELPARDAEVALAELAGAGLATADSFAGLRALLAPAARRGRGIETAGRWSALPRPGGTGAGAGAGAGAGVGGWGPGPGPGRGDGGGAVAAPAGAQRPRLPEEAVQAYASALLRRWGVVFQRVLEREGCAVPWRELAVVYRRMEARGEIRGGRFVSGFAGEQFALPDAVGRLRSVRKLPPSGRLLAISAADPLNLTGIITPEARVPAVAGNRVLYRDGVPVAALEARQLRRLPGGEDYSEDVLRVALSGRGDDRGNGSMKLTRRTAGGTAMTSVS